MAILEEETAKSDARKKAEAEEAAKKAAAEEKKADFEAKVEEKRAGTAIHESKGEALAREAAENKAEN